MIIPFATASAAEKQLDQLQNIFNATVLASIVIILADAAAEKDVSFLGFKTETSSAYGVAALAFVMLFLFAAQALARVRDTVVLVDSDEIAKVLGTVFSHRWPLNPFSYSGPTLGSTIHSSFGMPLLVFQWWLGLLALALLWNRMSMEAGAWEFGFWVAYICAGVLGLIALLRVQQAILQRLNTLAATQEGSELAVTPRTVQSAFKLRITMSLVSTGLGYGVYYAFTHIGA